MQIYQKHLTEGEMKALSAVRSYADAHLGNIFRRSGESYAEHGWEVAKTLLECTNDISLLSIAILHDILIHPQGEELLKESPLSTEEQEAVLKMHALRRLHIDKDAQDLDKVIDIFTEDVRLLPLRMAHRLTDVRNISRFQKKLQKEIARETLHMYTAIAGRLGMQIWRYEMEDTSLCILHPKICSDLREKYESMKATDILSLEHTIHYLRQKLHSHGIDAEFRKRIKGMYSTYRKMIIKKRRFEELTDRLAIRILVDSDEECYRALGVIHAVMHPMPARLKDYIGSPKENGYKSIHTVVYPLPGVTEMPIEIQIRTRDMHSFCEFGAASHNLYKDHVYALANKSTRVNLFRNLQSLKEESNTPKQFGQVLRTYFREDQVAVFDTDNNLYHLKKPATALDFMCHAFPKRLSTIKELLINGRKRPLGTELRDGDIIQAEYSRHKSINRTWLKECEHRQTTQTIKELLKA